VIAVSRRWGRPVSNGVPGKIGALALKIPIFIKFITLSTLLTIMVSTIISVAILRKQVEDFREQLISLGASLVLYYRGERPG
jgi:Na+-driven multidrug efflux pump